MRSGPGSAVSICLLVSLPAMGAPQANPSPRHVAITSARISTGTGDVLPTGTIVIDAGLIKAVGASVEVPDGAWVIDGRGKYVYPGLIDALSDLGLATENDEASSPREPDPPFAAGPEDRPGTTSWRAAADELKLEDGRIARWRAHGFTTAVSSPAEGIFPGQAVVINLAGERARDMVVATPAALRINLTPPGHRRSFPGSLMGVIAYVRQSLLDAKHYRESWRAYESDPRGRTRPGYDRALAPIAEAASAGVPLLVPGHLEHEIRRAVRLASDLGTRSIVYGGHQGYEVAQYLASERVPVIVSVKWPEADEDADPEREEPLRVLRLRKNAPTTPARLERAGAEFAFYSDGIEEPETILANVRKAVEAGLSREGALRGLTSGPARIFGVDDRLGSLEAGKIANLLVADGDLFDESTTIETVFVDGQKFEIRGSEEPATAPQADAGGASRGGGAARRH